MKKILSVLLLLIFSVKFYSQLDREHWFAPMMDRSDQSHYYQSVYMSTNEIVPFDVVIYNNNEVVATVKISKNNPNKFSFDNSLGLLNDRSKIITTQQSDLFKPISKGIYLKGEKPFFATLRFSVNQHAEIITSKGTAGIGTKFFATPAPIEANLTNVGFMTSIMATEDGTEITIDNFNPSVKFSDNTPRNKFKFTLNKGQSYIIDGEISSGGNNFGTNPNKYGFIGARIASNHPITVTNGNFNGQYVYTNDRSSDILMDQSVPVDRLGNEFVLVKGKGAIFQPGSSDYDSNMEKAFVVATEDGTDIYVNDETLPVNPSPLKAGEFYVVQSEKYKNKGSNHYNLYIRSTQKVYVFQLLAGTDGSSGTPQIATGGYNYIPPLSCYLPKVIDEIGFVNENEGYINGFYSGKDKPTKLNIITEKDAVVEIERNQQAFNLLPSDGPFDIVGKNDWVTYSITRDNLTGPNSISGNIKVKSSKAVTAGISAGDGAVGYGGYFAGFSYKPYIIKQEGECIPGVKLSVSEGFTSYLWLKKSKSGGYDPAPGINNLNIYEPNEVGIYSVKIQESTCPEIQTQDFKFLNCTTYTLLNYEVCGSIDIVPSFVLSDQTYNPATVKIDLNPSKGKVVIDSNGVIKYSINKGEKGDDSFKFSFCGKDSLPDCETVQVNLHLNDLESQDAILEECSDSGLSIFDLSKAEVTLDTSVKKVYYKSLNGAENEIESEVIDDFNNFKSSDAIIYVRLSNNSLCETIQKIELKTIEPPIFNENLYNKVHCDDEDGFLDEKYVVDIGTVTSIIFGTEKSYDIKYYNSFVKADKGGNDNIDGKYVFNQDNAKIWIRVESKKGCVTVKEINLKIGEKTPLISSSKIIEVCDDDLDATYLVQNLTSTYKSLFTNDYSTNVKFFVNESDAINPAATNNIDEINVVNNQLLYVRVTNELYCSSLAQLIIKIKLPKKSNVLEDKTICPDQTTDLDAGSYFDSYAWYSEANPSQVISTSSSVGNLHVGKYFVILNALSPTDCPYKQHVEIKASELPTIESIETKGSSVKINVKGGKEPYLYSIDGYNYQSSNVFNDVTKGVHKAYVISADNCAPVVSEFSIIEIYNMISPNGDGINDVLDMSLLKYKSNVKFKIVDRQGKIIFEGNPKNNFIWDGNYNGKVLPTSTYWYYLEWQESANLPPLKQTGWILLKNRNSD